MPTLTLSLRGLRSGFAAALLVLLPLAAWAQVTEGSASNGSTTEGSASNGSTTEGSASNGSTTEGSTSGGTASGTSSYDAPLSYNLGGGTVSLATAILNGGTVTNGTLAASTAFTGYSGSITASLSGSAALTKSTGDTLILAGANSYTGGTTINAGTLQIGNGGTLGDLPGNATNNAALVFNRSDTYTYANVISGSGNVTAAGGTIRFTQAQTYTGTTTVMAGTLLINDALSATSVLVQNGGTLGGTGTLGGAAEIAAGGILAPGDSVGTLTFAGGLVLNAGAVVNFDLGSTSDLLRISGGSLTGPASGQVTFNVNAGDGFGAAAYTLFDFTGATLSGFDLSDFTLGLTPSGYTYSLAFAGDTLQLTAAAAVPEPGTFALGAGALVLVAVIVRRRPLVRPGR